MSIFDTLDMAAEKISDIIQEVTRKDEDYITILTFPVCMKLIDDECKLNPAIKFFTLSAERNNAPKGKYDNFIVTLSLLDAECNVLRINTTECKYVMHVGQLNDDITSLLNGKKSVTIAVDFIRRSNSEL